MFQERRPPYKKYCKKAGHQKKKSDMMGFKCKKSFKYIDQEIMKNNIKTSLTNVLEKQEQWTITYT